MHATISESVNIKTDAVIEGVAGLIEARLKSLPEAAVSGDAGRLMRPGKMLRTRLAARLYAAVGRSPGGGDVMLRACAAVELAHTGSLCHDDIIDSALVRRFAPSLWRQSGAGGAVLAGDLLLCEAFDIIMETGRADLGRAFVSKIREVVRAETIQELQKGSDVASEEDMIDIARGKTGPLFAFAAMACAEGDPVLSSDLEEAGYLIGTAYQIGDDMLDITGAEDSAGKTLGTDRTRQKSTIPLQREDGRRRAVEVIGYLLESARKRMSVWEEYGRALDSFLALDLNPVLGRCVGASFSGSLNMLRLLDMPGQQTFRFQR